MRKQYFIIVKCQEDEIVTFIIVSLLIYLLRRLKLMRSFYIFEPITKPIRWINVSNSDKYITKARITD